MRPSYPLDVELARQSRLFGKVIFLVATPGTGAEVLARALGEFPGVAAIPVETILFSQGVSRLLGQWQHEPSDQGFHDLLDDQEFLLAARLLADAPLEAALAAIGGERLVEYSADHIQHLDDIRALYPDASLVHVVRDGRLVADRLSAGSFGLAARFAARRWVDDQRAAWEAGGQVDAMMQFEGLMDRPREGISTLVDGLGIDLDEAGLTAAVSHFKGAQSLAGQGGTGRAGAIVEIVAPEVLQHFQYDLNQRGRSARVAAWSEMAMYGALASVLDLRRRAQHRLATRYGADAWRPAGAPPS